MKDIALRVTTWLCLVVVAATATAFAASTENRLVPFGSFVTEKAEGFGLVRNSKAAPLFLDKNDYKGVLRAAGDLQADIKRVTGIKPRFSTDGAPAVSSSTRSI